METRFISLEDLKYILSSSASKTRIKIGETVKIGNKNFRIKGTVNSMISLENTTQNIMLNQPYRQ